MKIAIITVFLSFLLEGICSNYIPIHSALFLPLFTLVSLIVVYPFFYNQKKNYIILSFLVGLFYDLAYTDTVLYHAFLFIIMALLIERLNVWISNSALNVAILTFVVIILYRIISYTLLILVGYIEVNIEPLLRSIASSLILNMIYSAIVYVILDRWSQKKHVLKID